MYSDLHCHSFLRSFERTDPGTTPVMSPNPCDDTSVWRKALDAGDLTDMEHAIGFIGYTQADFTDVSANNGALVVASLFAVEDGFFELRKGVVSAFLTAIGMKNLLEAFLGRLISKFKLEQIEYTQNMVYDYFDVLMKQVNFMMNGPKAPDTSSCADALYSNLPGVQYEVVMPGAVAAPGAQTIKVLWSIEGGNSLWTTVTGTSSGDWDCRNFDKKNIKDAVAKYRAIDDPNYRNLLSPAMISAHQLTELIPWEVCDQVAANLTTLKNLSSRPFFITIGHHFYNGMVGHPSSLQPLTGDTKVFGIKLHLLDQSFGCNSDITNLGWVVINEMLQDANNRILVDVKHMSIMSRQSYYAFRKNNYPDVPIVFSHGAVYGASLQHGIYTSNADIINNTTDDQAGNFYKHDVNLFDEDIKEIVLSNGIIGIEFDKRVNGVKAERSDNDLKPDMIWHNMRYIAELANTVIQPTQSVWDFISLGTDYDGIINPMPDFGTADRIPMLRTMISGLLTTYLATTTAINNQDRQMGVDAILDKIFFQNIIDFAAKNYR